MTTVHTRMRSTARDSFLNRADRGGLSRREHDRQHDRQQGRRPPRYVATDATGFRVDDDPYLGDDNDRCRQCGTKAESPHDGGCRYTLRWNWHRSDALGWSGWVLEHGNGTRAGYVMRQVVPNDRDEMVVTWVPFNRTGARLTNGQYFPQGCWIAVEHNYGVSGVPVNY